MDIYRLAGKRLKELRTQAGMTQEDLAEKAEITPAFLSYLENARKKGSLETYAKLAQGLGVELGQLFISPGSGPKAYPAITMGLGLTVAEAKAVRQMIKALRNK